MRGTSGDGLGLFSQLISHLKFRRTARVHQAAYSIVEALEARQLLSLTAADAQHFRYVWNHLGPYARHDVAVLEYNIPSFNTALNADISALGLARIAPLAVSDTTAPADGKSRRAHRHHPIRHVRHPQKPPRHHAAHPRKDGPIYPYVASATQYTDSLPQQFTITFNENLYAAGLWSGALNLIDLNSGVNVPISGSDPQGYWTTNDQVTLSFSPSAVPADGNYAAVLHGASIGDGTYHLADTSDVAVGPQVSNADEPGITNGFFFFDGDFNGDRSVNGADLARVLGNYNKPGNYSQGDANFDGTVGFSDLAIVDARYGKSLPQLAAPGAPTTVATSADRIEITWPAVPGATQYDVYRDQELVGSNVQGTTYLDGGLTEYSYHEYMIVAKDAAGNTSYPSPFLSAHTGTAYYTPISIYPPADPTSAEGGTASLWTTFQDSGSSSGQTATISWKDGAGTTTALADVGGGGTITASHVYASAGTYFGKLTVSDPYYSNTELFESDISDLPLTAAVGPALFAAVGADTGGTMAVFTDADPNATAALYTANIAWGDGTTSAGTITQTGPSFSVTGDHTYLTENTYAPIVTIKDIGGSTAVVTDGVDADTEPPPLAVTGVPAANEGDTYLLTASIADADGAAEDYAWSIAWGDGSTPDAFTAPPGTFSHVYTQPSAPGEFTITATAADDESGQTYTSLPATQDVAIAEVPPTLSISGDSTITEGDTYVLGGSFVDVDGDMPDSWTVDWGDGSGPVGYPGYTDGDIDNNDSISGPVDAAHTYSKGTYTITASALIEGGTYPAGSQVVTVADATPAFSVTGDSTFTKGQPYSITAGFSDFDSPSGWSIAWGDGNTSSGTGNIPATLGHTYATGTSAGYTIAAAVTTVDGTYTNLTSVDETPPTFSVTGAGSTVEGATYSLVPTFDDPNGNIATSYTVAWGDGNSSTGLTHVYKSALPNGGEYNILAAANDSDGQFYAPEASVVVTDATPTPTFTLDPASSPVTAGVAFNMDAALNDPGGQAANSIRVDWGDGETDVFPGTSSRLGHVYATSGEHDAAASFIDQDGTYIANAGISVQTSGTLTLNAGYADEGTTYYQLAYFTGQNGDTAASYTISWGDGKTDSYGTDPDYHGTFPHVYEDDGTDTVTAVVQTKQNATYTASAIVTVNEIGPFFTIAGTGNALDGRAYTLLADYSDPGGATASYAINWGDGTSDSQSGPTLTHEYHYDPDPQAQNIYAATVTATNGDDDWTRGGEPGITVRPAGAGELTVDAGSSINEDQTYTLTCNFTDSRQDPSTGAAYEINWGDGAAGYEGAGSSLDATHIYAEEGSYHIEVDAVYTDTINWSWAAMAVTDADVSVKEVTPTLTASGSGYGDYYTLTATFTDGTGDDDAADPSWTVSWGDGTGDVYQLYASVFAHTYAAAPQTGSDYSIKVTTTSEGQTFTASTSRPGPGAAEVGITSASIGVAYERGNLTAGPSVADVIDINRTGGDDSEPLTVGYSLAGTASTGEYQVYQSTSGALLDGSVTIPAGFEDVQIAVMPVEDYTPRWTDDVTMSLTPSGGGEYNVNPAKATHTTEIANDDLGITLDAPVDAYGSPEVWVNNDGSDANIVPLTLNVPSQANPGALITLAVDTAKVNLWDSPSKGNLILGGATSSISWNGSVPQRTYYVEAIGGSSDIGDVFYTLSDSDAGAESAPVYPTANEVIKRATNPYVQITDGGKDVTGVNAGTVIVGEEVFLQAAYGPAQVFPQKLSMAWSIPGTSVGSYFTNATISASHPPTLTNNNVLFYWVDGGDPQNINQGIARNVTFTLGNLSRQTTLNVVRPVATIQATTDIVAITTDKINATNYKGFLQFGPGTAPGITFKRVNSTVPAGFQGTWFWVQVLSDDYAVTDNQGVTHHAVDPFWTLDDAKTKQYPYSTDQNGTGDSPELVVSSSIRQGMSVSFTADMYLMFKPTGVAAAIEVPIRVVSWYWGGQASWNAAAKKWVGSNLIFSANPPDQDTVSLPSWDQSNANTPWVPPT